MLQNYDLKKQLSFLVCREQVKETATIHSEEGFVLLTAMMILIALTLTGIAATNTSMFEMMISGNERFAQQQFLLADSGVNTMLADSKAGEPGRPIPQNVAMPLPTCTIPGTHLPYYNHASITGVSFYYLGKISDNPFLAEILVCATRDNTVSSITVGVEFGLGSGGIPTSGGNEYN